MTFGLFWFFLETDCLALAVELDDAVALRIAHLISKNACATLDGECVAIEVEFPIENVVAKNERCTRIPNKFRADQKGLCDPFRFRLLGVLDPNAELRPVSQIVFQHWQIFWSRDDEHLA